MTGRIERRIKENPHLLFSGGHLLLDTGFAFTTSYTVEARVQTNDFTLLGQRIVVEDTGANDGWAMSLFDNSNFGHARFYHRELEDVITDSDTGIKVDTEHHIAIVFDTGAALKSIYVDGRLAGQDTGVDNVLTGSKQAAYIGGNGAGTRYFSGWIDDVRIWDVARTAAEIDANKANGAIAGTETGLRHLWVFDTDTGYQLDKTGNGNGATLVGDVAFAASPLTESTTKRILAAVTQSISKRVTAAASAVSSKRVEAQGPSGGQGFNFWGYTWGDRTDTKESGALSFGDAWARSWQQADNTEGLQTNHTQRVGSGPAADNTKRVTEEPEA